MHRLADKVAIITGAAMGIGQAIAYLFAQEGASVVVADIDRKAGWASVEKIITGGSKAIFIDYDVANSAQVQNLVKIATETYGGIDILVNYAGIAYMTGTTLIVDGGVMAQFSGQLRPDL